MPVVDGTLVPNAPLTAAETVVAWERLNHRILTERQSIERVLLPQARRLGYAVGAGLHSAKLTKELEQKFALLLAGVYQFGIREVQRELSALRARGTASAPALAAQREDVGPGAAKRRFDQLAGTAAADIERAAAKAAGDGEVAASGAAAKQLHVSVLEVVTLGLNLGRSQGADRSGRPADLRASKRAVGSEHVRPMRSHPRVDRPSRFRRVLQQPSARALLRRWPLPWRDGVR